MRRFHFHLRSGDQLTRDEEGADFADYTAAFQEVTLAARELVIEAIRRGGLEIAETFVIVDGLGKECGTLPLAAVLPRVRKREL
jgi:hypothetical protein